jgi:hypothetical protein
MLHDRDGVLMMGQEALGAAKERYASETLARITIDLHKLTVVPVRQSGYKELSA